MFCLQCISVYPVHNWRLLREARDGISPMELELQTVLSYHVGSRNWTRVFWKRSQCSWPLAISPVPNENFPRPGVLDIFPFTWHLHIFFGHLLFLKTRLSVSLVRVAYPFPWATSLAPFFSFSNWIFVVVCYTFLLQSDSLLAPLHTRLLLNIYLTNVFFYFLAFIVLMGVFQTKCFDFDEI